MTERAEYHVMSHPQTFPRGLAPDYRGVAVGTTLGRRGKNLFSPHVSLTPRLSLHRATAVFGHAGGRLVVPNTGECTMRQLSFNIFLLKSMCRLQFLQIQLAFTEDRNYKNKLFSFALFKLFNLVGVDR